MTLFKKHNEQRKKNLVKIRDYGDQIEKRLKKKAWEKRVCEKVNEFDERSEVNKIKTRYQALTLTEDRLKSFSMKTGLFAVINDKPKPIDGFVLEKKQQQQKLAIIDIDAARFNESCMYLVHFWFVIFSFN